MPAETSTRLSHSFADGFLSFGPPVGGPEELRLEHVPLLERMIAVGEWLRRAPPRVVAMEERMASRLAAREKRFASKIGGLAHRDCVEDDAAARRRLPADCRERERE